MRETNKANLEVHLKKVELQDNAKQLKELSGQKAKTDQEVKQLNDEKLKLEEEKKTLEQQLEARAVLKKNQAIAYAASLSELGPIQTIIVDAANKYGTDPVHMLNIAKCESTFNPNAGATVPVWNGEKAQGLFQFIPSTWARMSAQAGYTGASVFDPVANANVAAWAFANGHSGEWECH